MIEIFAHLDYKTERIYYVLKRDGNDLIWTGINGKPTHSIKLKRSSAYFHFGLILFKEGDLDGSSARP